MSTKKKMTVEQWAEQVELEIGNDATEYSLAMASGKIGGVDIDLDADDDYGRKITSLDGTMTVIYDERSGHWYPEGWIW